ncbi:MAG: transcription-repair coupling factor [Oscillospiraceae bacterium]|nr:transcription-repair coupling factor [Oscillospiraceae bacterium]
MELLLSALKSLPEYEKLLELVSEGKTAALSGVGGLVRAHFAAALFRDCDRPMVLICQDETAAQRMQEELAAFLGKTPALLPHRELTFYDAAGISRGWEQKRLRQLYDLACGNTKLLICTLEALSLRTIPKQTLFSSAVTLRQGGSYGLDDLIRRLTAMGYSRTTLVEGTGQFAVRGGILDVYSPNYDDPIRVEFWGDDLDAMGFFDSISQRRAENLEEAVLLPVAETVVGMHPGGAAGLLEDLTRLSRRLQGRKNPFAPLIETVQADCGKLENGLPFSAADRYMDYIYPTFASACDYISKDAVVVFCDHGALARAAAAQEERFGLELDSFLQSGHLCGELCEYYQEYEQVCAAFRDRPCVFLDNFLASSYPGALPPKALLSITGKQLPSYGGSVETAISDLAYYKKNGFRSLVLCGSRRRCEILQEMLEARGAVVKLQIPAGELPRPGEILLTDGALPAGLEYPAMSLAVLTEGQLTAAPKKKVGKRRKKATNRQKLDSFADLSPGDLVVHEHHGIGRYVAMEQMRVGGVVKDYVKIAYQGTDVLYVPATQLDLVGKYIGGGEDAPVRLNKLGSDQWQKTKARARSAARDLAAGLIQLYAARRRCQGYAFAADSPWQKEFEDSFEYAETDDQLRCIEEIKRDMESPTPMDRLLCGDVGFGKTEVALRAAMKAMMDSKQVAILVPTTVLARQHYVTAHKRFGSFPVNIQMLSRFCTPAQMRKTVAAIENGTVDLVIGTHKLLQKDIRFKNLGLLIVDEEQRFGVSHKERLKEMSVGVDVLTLSATPIPRTLNMALSGLRDMSTIEEPPRDRYPVQTYVLEHDDRMVDEAIRRELQRGGQVYYLHNRVESIEQTAARLRARHPGVEIAVGHGKMDQEELSDIMQRMSEGEVQILVCTTIIETGIDISNVNTLIIEDADKMGLAQLHQLRGRVGRSSRHAFAYLTFRKGKVLTEVAEKRLSAIREFAEFGSGFKIAMRDLEIRGAGDLLGAEQSGHMMSVGYDMYLKLLEEAVLEERGEERVKEPECVADLSVTANISKTYVASGEQRMDLYRRMAAIRSQEDADEILDEIVDRFGDPPKGVLNLVDIALLRARAAAVGIDRLEQKGDSLCIGFDHFDFAAISGLCAQPLYQRRIFFAAGEKPTVELKLKKGEDPLKMTQSLVGHYRENRIQEA